MGGLKPTRALLPLSWLYAAGAAARNRAYEAGLVGVRRAGAPVVCVGNLTTGGTGKTPLVRYIAERLRALGGRPGVVSRGYQRKDHTNTCVLVSDGQNVLVRAEQGGDEPVLLARELPGVPIAVCSDRYAAARRLLDDKLCDCIVMDDGFQHRGLARDADLVLVDAHMDLAREPMLPAGHLREPLRALNRATAIVHTKVEGPHLDSNRSLCVQTAPRTPQFEARFETTRLRKLDGTTVGPVPALAGRRVVAVAGLANPAPFFQSLRHAGAEVVELPFPDHAPYDPGRIVAIERRVAESAAYAIVTTAKDAVKLAGIDEKPGLPWLVLDIAVRLSDEAGMDSLLRAALTAGRPR